MIPTIPKLCGLACTLIVIWILSPTRSLRAQADLSCTPIERIIPPIGLEIPPSQRSTWLMELQELEHALAAVDTQLEADIAVLLKACRYAIEFQELYRPEDFAKVDRLIALARQRIAELREGSPSWLPQTGRQIRGYRSTVDASVQPLGLVFPKEIGKSGKVPLYVWLHGRGDKTTDLHFLCERMDKDGQIAPEGAIVVHPFGRQCIGYKSAGETDVMEVVDWVCQHYPVDQQRIVLMGFSMGGAGVWHLAAHYGERFVAASPGAGFAETARYRRLTPAQMPAEYEQMLWRMYDVPGYTRNLFNLPFVAYSGEEDPQIQAAQVMAEAFETEGRSLTHLIGPGMGHKYHPDTLKDILQRMAEAVARGKIDATSEFYIQTQHLRYGSRSWLSIDGMDKQYSDARADAKKLDTGEGFWNIQTKNATRLALDPSVEGGPSGKIQIDGQLLTLEPQVNISGVPQEVWRLSRDGQSRWHIVTRFPELVKRPGLSGPIDDAFIDPFLVVVPSGKSSNPQVDQWVSCELENFRLRWRSIFRGEPRVKLDHEVTQEDLEQFHVAVWGTPESNQLTHRVLAESGTYKLPIRWDSSRLSVGQTNFDATRHAPILIYPNPLAPHRYVVFNSGPTFRSAHDSTNSLQNPHLPDWAVISFEEAPSAERPGKIAHTGFFDGNWQLDRELMW